MTSWLAIQHDGRWVVLVKDAPDHGVALAEFELHSDALTLARMFSSIARLPIRDPHMETK